MNGIAMKTKVSTTGRADSIVRSISTPLNKKTINTCAAFVHIIENRVGPDANTQLIVYRSSHGRETVWMKADRFEFALDENDVYSCLNEETGVIHKDTFLTGLVDMMVI